MNCTSVREALPEHALGAVSSDRAGAFEGHLAWCAACRKEARDLLAAAASVGFVLAPAEPLLDLEDRVVEAVQHAAGRERPGARPPRRRRLIVVLAAALAFTAAGGAVLASRVADRDPVVEAQAERDALNEFRRWLVDSEFLDGETEANLGMLEPLRGAEAAGSAMTIVVPLLEDRVIVVVEGLSSRPRLLPYTVVLRGGGPRGVSVRLAAIYQLEEGGGATVARVVREDLTGLNEIVIRDARGRAVLRGVLAAEAPVASPSP